MSQIQVPAGYTEDSWAAYVMELTKAAEMLHDHGVFLKSLGPLAAPCVAGPYNRLIPQFKMAAARFLNACVAAMPEEARDEMRRRLVTVAELINSIPDAAEMWSDAPAQWHEHGVVVPVPVGPSGKLGEGEPIPPTRAMDVWRRVERQIVHVAAQKAAESWWMRGLGWGSRGVRAVWRGLAWAGRGAGAVLGSKWLFVAYLGCEIGVPVVGALWDHFFGDEPEPDVTADLSRAYRLVEDYLKATHQQLISLAKIAQASNTPGQFRRLMEKTDPWQEKAYQEPADMEPWSAASNAGGMKKREPPVYWGLVLIGGTSVASALAGEME